MKHPDAVSASVEVALEPMNAFAVFTEEINRWWRPGSINWNDSDRAVGIHIEPGVGGRWIEVYDEAAGEGFECGRITVWEPGTRSGSGTSSYGKTIQTRLSSLFRYRDYTQLLQHAEVIETVPLFGNFAICDA